MSTKKTVEKAKPTQKVSQKTKIDMVFTKQNYLITAVAFVVVVIGFFLMYGGKEDIYSFRKITIAPIVVVSGFLIGVFAIMYNPNKNNGVS